MHAVYLFYISSLNCHEKIFMIDDIPKDNNKFSSSSSVISEAGNISIGCDFQKSNTKLSPYNTAQKMKFSIKYFFSKCDQIRSFLPIWSHLLRKSLIENFIFCAVQGDHSHIKLLNKGNLRLYKILLKAKGDISRKSIMQRHEKLTIYSAKTY